MLVPKETPEGLSLVQRGFLVGESNFLVSFLVVNLRHSH